MTYMPFNHLPAPPVINTLQILGQYDIFDNGSPSAVVWPTANRAYFVGFALTAPAFVTQMYTVNGTTASNNFDIGIYSNDGTKIVSTGSTAMTGTSVVQSVSVTATTLGPGEYYLAMAMNGTSGAPFALTPSTVWRTQWRGVYSQNTAFPLPANATFATVASAFVPFFGFTTAAAITL